jgi:hypothetical protein
MSQQPQQPPQGMNVNADPNTLKGLYSNLMQVSHSKEEIILDFFSSLPPAASLNARIIVNPAHFKRITAVMADVLKKYEEQFGTINEGQSQANSEFGFAAKS